jgi:hypothetical protein
MYMTSAWIVRPGTVTYWALCDAKSAKGLGVGTLDRSKVPTP